MKDIKTPHKKYEKVNEDTKKKTRNYDRIKLRRRKEKGKKLRRKERKYKNSNNNINNNTNFITAEEGRRRNKEVLLY